MPLSVDPSLYSGSNHVSHSPARLTPSGSPGPSPRHTHYRLLNIAKTPSASPPRSVAADSATPSSKSSATASLSPGLPVPLLATLLRPRTFVQRAVTLAACTAGIYVCFLSYAVLQERIYKKRYGEQQEQFQHAWFLVLIQIIGNMAFAACSIAYTRPPPATVPLTAYTRLSLSYIGAMLLSNWALSYMSYPAQSLAKSCKLIPVMLARILINKATYEAREYVQVALITGGISIFMAWQAGEAGNGKGGGEGGTFSVMSMGVDGSWFGLALCLAALALDGYTGPTQERVSAEYKVSMSQMMFYLNLYSLPSLLALLLVTSQLTAGIRFALSYPSFLVEALIFSLCSALGQSCVLFTLLTFNSLLLVTITTTRKFATILLSVALYGHHLSGMQWAGIGLVWLGLSMDVYVAWSRQSGGSDGDVGSGLGWNRGVERVVNGRLTHADSDVEHSDDADSDLYETSSLLRGSSAPLALVPEASESDTS